MSVSNLKVMSMIGSILFNLSIIFAKLSFHGYINDISFMEEKYLESLDIMNWKEPNLKSLRNTQAMTPLHWEVNSLLN